jgi:cytochrome P450
MIELLNVFGPNISTVFGRDWQRHKKATGPPFNEQNSKIVWDEALRQGREALQHWKEKSLDAVRTTAEDAKTFSLNVISCAGFRKSYSFLTKEGAVGDEDHSMTYKKSLSIILENAILILILGPKFLVQWRAYLPKSWMEVGQATIEFKAYMSEMLKEERRLIAEGKPSAGNLMTSLIRASEEQKGNEKNENGEGRLTGLSEEEIFGNIFVFNFAGHDTISHTLAYAIHLLAAHPHVQDVSDRPFSFVFCT